VIEDFLVSIDFSPQPSLPACLPACLPDECIRFYRDIQRALIETCILFHVHLSTPYQYQHIYSSRVYGLLVYGVAKIDVSIRDRTEATRCMSKVGRQGVHLEEHSAHEELCRRETDRGPRSELQAEGHRYRAAKVLKTALHNHIICILRAYSNKATKTMKRSAEEMTKGESTDAAVQKNNISESAKLPQKRFFRSRAHCNPLSHNDSFQYPAHPDKYDWAEHYPNVNESERVIRFLDIGMGFGGLTVALAQLYPDKLVLGMEIRAKVCEYVRLRIEALRKDAENQSAAAAPASSSPPSSSSASSSQIAPYQNASCMRTNCMRYLPNYFRKGQLEKLFFCFPDPHFKAKNHRRRIISFALLTEYAHFLMEGGMLYTITDVAELHEWHVARCDEHPCFERVPDEQALEDPAVKAMTEETEEGKKVARLGGKKHFAVYRRRAQAELPTPLISQLWASSQ
jgi:tRNA (guanine-N7-)-methyltransferase